MRIQRRSRLSRYSAHAPARIRNWDGIGLVCTRRQLEEVAAAVAFLASDEARWITGIVLPVDGGQSTDGGPEWGK